MLHLSSIQVPETRLWIGLEWCWYGHAYRSLVPAPWWPQSGFHWGRAQPRSHRFRCRTRPEKTLDKSTGKSRRKENPIKLLFKTRCIIVTRVLCKNRFRDLQLVLVASGENNVAFATFGPYNRFQDLPQSLVDMHTSINTIRVLHRQSLSRTPWCNRPFC